MFTLVPIRPRWRGERRSLRTFAARVSLLPSHALNPDTPRRLSTPFLTPFTSTPTSPRVGDYPQFAMLEATSCLAMTLQRYDFELDKDAAEVGMEMGATIHTAGGLPMRVTRRK